MKETILVFLIITTIHSFALTQINAVTSEGRNVTLNNDGIWKYAKSNVQTETTTVDASYCSEFLVSEEDKMTGKSTVTSKEMLVISKDGGNYGFGLYVLKTDSGLIRFSIQVVGAGNCIDKDSKMNVLFRDGTRLEMRNEGKFNCDSKYTQYFGEIFSKKNNTEELKQFAEKEVETIRIWTTKGYVEEDLTPNQSSELMHVVKCIIKN